MSLNNRGTAHFMGTHDPAKPLLERAVAIETRARGLDHPETAEASVNLASVLQRQGGLGPRRDARRAGVRAVSTRGRSDAALSGRVRNVREVGERDASAAALALERHCFSRSMDNTLGRAGRRSHPCPVSRIVKRSRSVG